MVKVNITNIYGMSQTSSAQIAQNEVTQVAKQLCFNELGIYFYNSGNETDGEMSARIDGINASLQFGDIVIVQIPTWNAPEFEQMYLQKLKSYGARIILFVQDVPPLMFEANYHDWMQPQIKLYEQADLLILPSKNMAQRLFKEGLKMDNIVYQNLWDRITNYEPSEIHFRREINFLGSQERFPFTKDWKYNTRLKLFANVTDRDENLNVHYMGFYPGDFLLNKLDSGYGLCWSVNTEEQKERDYSKLNVSYKLSTYLVAGLPVIANREISAEQFIKEHNLGIILDDLSEIDDALNSIDEKEYYEMVDNVKRVGYLLRNGYTTKSILIEAVKKVMLSK